MSLILHPGSPLVIGHRGAAAVRPENTLPAFQHALDVGVDAVEFDVRVTGDGVAVVHHDASTLRTCGEHQLIEQSSIGALRRLDAGATFAGEYASPRRTPIPLLDEVLDLTKSIPVIIECKTGDAAPYVVDVLRSHGATERALVGSYLNGAMRHVRAADVPSGASHWDMWMLMLRNAVRWAPKRLPCAAMCIPERGSGMNLPIARFAAWGRAIGVPVHVWTVNAASDANRLWDAGVTGVISDDPARMIAARAERALG